VIPICLKVNGEDCPVQVKAHWSLAFVLREKIGLTGTKTGCEMGTCGSCTILLDGKPIFCCLKMAVDAEGHELTTIEGIENDGVLHPLQQTFIDGHGMQCGYCTPGMIIAAKALLEGNSNPSEHEVRLAIGGHLCRCGTYVRIVKSIMDAAEIVRNT